LASRITIRDVEELTSIGKSRHGSKDFSREFKKMSQRPTILSNRSQKRNINNLEHEVEAQAEEIELLRKKLQFETVLESKRVLKPPTKAYVDLVEAKVDVRYIMALGLEKVKNDMGIGRQSANFEVGNVTQDAQGDCQIF